MLDLLNLPGIKPVDMRHEGKCLVIVAEPVTVQVPLCGDCNIPMHRHGTRKNKFMDTPVSVEHKYDVSLLKDLIREHVEATGSPRGKEILENFGEYLPKFKKVLPHDYDKMLRLIAKMEEKGEDSEQAQIEAFYAMKNTK